MSDEMTGRFLWYELMTTDPDAAKAFYTEVLGWKTQEWEDSPMPYTMWMVGKNAIGGLMPLPEEAKAMGAPPHWMAYVGVQDVGAAVEKARRLGATILNGPFEIPQVGTIAIFQDPQGAVISFYTPAGEAPAPGGPPSVGTISWNELATTDVHAAWDFYRQVFGWKITEDMEMPPEMGGGIYRMYGGGQWPFGGIGLCMGERPPSWLYYIQVEDLDAAVRRALNMGGTLLNGPMEVPGGDRVAQLMDPQGAAFALHFAAPRGE